MSIRNLGLNPRPVSLAEWWVLFAAVVSFTAVLAWFWSVRPGTAVLWAFYIAWLMIVSATLAVVRIAAYRRQTRARERLAEQVAEALAAKQQE